MCQGFGRRLCSARTRGSVDDMYMAGTRTFRVEKCWNAFSKERSDSSSVSSWVKFLWFHSLHNFVVRFMGHVPPCVNASRVCRLQEF